MGPAPACACRSGLPDFLPGLLRRLPCRADRSGPIGPWLGRQLRDLAGSRCAPYARAACSVMRVLPEIRWSGRGMAPTAGPIDPSRSTGRTRPATSPQRLGRSRTDDSAGNPMTCRQWQRVKTTDLSTIRAVQGRPGPRPTPGRPRKRQGRHVGHLRVAPVRRPRLPQPPAASHQLRQRQPAAAGLGTQRCRSTRALPGKPLSTAWAGRRTHPVPLGWTGCVCLERRGTLPPARRIPRSARPRRRRPAASPADRL